MLVVNPPGVCYYREDASTNQPKAPCHKAHGARLPGPATHAPCPPQQGVHWPVMDKGLVRDEIGGPRVRISAGQASCPQTTPYRPARNVARRECLETIPFSPRPVRPPSTEADVILPAASVGAIAKRRAVPDTVEMRSVAIPARGLSIGRRTCLYIDPYSVGTYLG